MNTDSPTQLARETLRQLALPHALAFGSRLLDREQGGVITFREFLAVARELIQQLPEQSAIYLAALVALDIGDDEEQLPRPAQPSPN